MDPTNSSQVPPMELPIPQSEAPTNLPEQPQFPPVTETANAQAVELGASQTQLPTDPVQAVTNLGPQPAVSTTFDPAQPVVPPASATSNLPPIADDNDLIEKEWVDKAKQIVEHTKSDPHEQNKEMSKMKIDYLKKRYNKDVKLVEE